LSLSAPCLTIDHALLLSNHGAFGPLHTFLLPRYLVRYTSRRCTLLTRERLHHISFVQVSCTRYGRSGTSEGGANGRQQRGEGRACGPTQIDSLEMVEVQLDCVLRCIEKRRLAMKHHFSLYTPAPPNSGYATTPTRMAYAKTCKEEEYIVPAGNTPRVGANDSDEIVTSCPRGHPEEVRSTPDPWRTAAGNMSWPGKID